MKYRYLLAASLASFASATSSFGFAEFGRGVLLLSTEGRVTYDSRLFGGRGEADDYIYTAHPRLIFRREAGLITLDSGLGVRFNRYNEYSRFDSEDLEANVTFRMPHEVGAGFAGTFDLNYDERTDLDPDTADRLRTEVFSARLTGSRALGLKTRLDVEGAFNRDRRENFNDRDSWLGSVAFSYLDFLGDTSLTLRYRRFETETIDNDATAIPELDQTADTYSADLSRPIYGPVIGTVGVGYRVLDRRVSNFAGTEERKGTIVRAGIRGPFLPQSRFPKLDSRISLYYEENESPGINDLGGRRFIGDASLSWQARERTEVNLSASRTWENTVRDFALLRTRFAAGINQRIGEFATGTVGVSYENADYNSLVREDDVLSFNAGYSYRISRFWTAGAQYLYRDSDSETAIANYRRHVVSLYATFIF